MPFPVIYDNIQRSTRRIYPTAGETSGFSGTATNTVSLQLTSHVGIKNTFVCCFLHIKINAKSEKNSTTLEPEHF